MRETKFIEQNKAKWEEFEKTMGGRHYKPEKLLQLFVQILDDLSFSRTFYPNRSVRVYLNSLAQQIFFTIYKNRRSRLQRFLNFWSDELPQLVYQSRREFLLAFLVFAISMLLGGLSAAMDSNFPALILGQDYIDMTLENIDAGDPMAVYKARGAFGMSLGITINNLFVAFLTFALGSFYIGAIIILVRNGIMVGVFQYFFIERDLFWESFLTIWTHGTLEISAIIIAGTAGLTMGKGLLFPGTYRRLQAFQRSSRRGIKIMIGITPIFITAGFIEGYLTRFTNAPDLLRGLFILVCLFFILGYFFLFPRVKAAIGFDTPFRETIIPPDKNKPIDFNVIKKSGVIFTDIFSFYHKYRSRIMLLGFAAALLYCLLVFISFPGDLMDAFYISGVNYGYRDSIGQYFYSTHHFMIPIASILTWSVFTFFLFRWIKKESGRSFSEHHLLSFIKVLLGISCVHLLLMINNWDVLSLRTLMGAGFFSATLLTFIIPVFLLWTYVMVVEEKNAFRALGRALSFSRQRYSAIVGLFLALTILGYLFMLILDSFLFSFFLELVSWVIHLEQEQMDQLSIVLLSFVTLFVLYLVVGMTLIAVGLLYYSLYEMAESKALKQDIQSIGISQKIKGLEREART